MCTVCGCGHPNVPAGQDHDHGSGHDAHGHGNGHHHHHHHNHHDEIAQRSADGALDFGAGLSGVHAPGMTQARIVEVERNILEANDGFALENRRRLAAAGTLCLNLVSSPGAGKTTLLVRTIDAMKGGRAVAVIEGDQQTSLDASRIAATGCAVTQINTGRGCHLDAHMVAHALDRNTLPAGGVLFIENVGNLVCPAGFDLGEAHKVVILSATEGDDKPLKYPDMFRAADLMIVNKADLLPYVDFDVSRCIGNAQRINPRIETLVLSATSGDGMAAWLDWIAARCATGVAGTLPAHDTPAPAEAGS